MPARVTDGLPACKIVFLIDLLNDRLIGNGLTEFLSDRLIYRLIDSPTDWLTEWLTEWLTDWLTDWLSNWQETSCLPYWLIDCLLTSLFACFFEWLPAWPTNWLTAWTTNGRSVHSLTNGRMNGRMGWLTVWVALCHSALKMLCYAVISRKPLSVSVFFVLWNSNWKYCCFNLPFKLFLLRYFCRAVLRNDCYPHPWYQRDLTWWACNSYLPFSNECLK